PQQGRPTGRHALPCGESGSCLTTQRTGDVQQQRLQGARAATTRLGQQRQSLCEDGTRTAPIATEETANLDTQGDASASPRQISNRAHIATMNASRTARAAWTRCRSAGCAQAQGQAGLRDEHTLESEPTQMRQQGRD